MNGEKAHGAGSGGLAGLLTLLRRLAREGLHHTLTSVRDDAVMIEVAVPGQRWEVEFMHDGTVQVEVFVSDGTIGDESTLSALLSELRSSEQSHAV